MVLLLRRAGITGWRANRWLTVAGRRICADFCFEAQRVIVEVDGRAWHGSDRWESDRSRDSAAAAAGWRVLRFTWRRIMEEPDAVVAEILGALGAWV